MQIKKTGMYGILTDEVTDISNIQRLLTFINFYNVDAGRTETKFIHTADLLEESEPTSPDALSIFTCLKTLLTEDLELPLANLKAFVSGRVSVMTGRETGVAARFRELVECNKLLNVHYVCHRLVLACSDTGDELKIISDFDLTMTQLLKFLKNSAKRLKIYIKTAIECRDFEKLLKREKKRVIRTMKKAVRTRSLSMDAGVEALYKEFVGFTRALRAMKDSAADGLLKKIDNVRFIGTFYILREVLPQLSILSKAFETGSPNFSRVGPSIEKAIRNMKSLVSNDTPMKNC